MPMVRTVSGLLTLAIVTGVLRTSMTGTACNDAACRCVAALTAATAAATAELFDGDMACAAAEASDIAWLR